MRGYGYVQRDKLSGGKFFKQLRHARLKYRKGSRAKRVIKPNRAGIEHRPAIVEKTFDDWETDTLLGKTGSNTIVSLAERKSKFYLISKMPVKSVEEVSRTLVGVLWLYRSHVHIVTADNGKEF